MRIVLISILFTLIFGHNIFGQSVDREPLTLSELSGSELLCEVAQYCRSKGFIRNDGDTIHITLRETSIYLDSTIIICEKNNLFLLIDTVNSWRPSESLLIRSVRLREKDTYFGEISIQAEYYVDFNSYNSGATFFGFIALNRHESKLKAIDDWVVRSME